MESRLAEIRERAVGCLEELESLILEASMVLGVQKEEVADFVCGLESLPRLLERLNETK